MEKVKKLLPTLIFNIAETIIIFLVGVALQLDIKLVILIMLTFMISRGFFGKALHFKTWYRCLIWSTLTNCQRFTLVLPIDLPAMTTIVPVYIAITINGVSTNIPLQDVIGNNFMSDQLRNLPKNACNCFGIARLIYGGNPQHFKVLNCVPSSSAISFDENGGNN